MDNKPVLFPKMYQWSYEEFLAVSQKRLEQLSNGISLLESSSSVDSPYPIEPWKNIIYCQSQCDQLQKDIKLTAEEFDVLKQESQDMANKLIELAGKGLMALHLAEKLISCGFWEKVEDKDRVSLPPTVNIRMINSIKIEEIKDTYDLQWATNVIQAEFPSYRIISKVINDQSFLAQKECIAKVIAIAEIIHELNANYVVKIG